MKARKGEPARAARWLLVGCALFAGSLVGCDTPPAMGAASASPEGSVASIHRRKCGACHVRPEPGTRTREHLEDAFGRHKHRVNLTPDQWSAMIDYLAAPATAPATAPQRVN